MESYYVQLKQALLQLQLALPSMLPSLESAGLCSSIDSLNALIDAQVEEMHALSD